MSDLAINKEGRSTDRKMGPEVTELKLYLLDCFRRLKGGEEG